MRTAVFETQKKHATFAFFCGAKKKGKQRQQWKKNFSSFPLLFNFTWQFYFIFPPHFAFSLSLSLSLFSPFTSLTDKTKSIMAIRIRMAPREREKEGRRGRKNGKMNFLFFPCRNLITHFTSLTHLYAAVYVLALRQFALIVLLHAYSHENLIKFRLTTRPLASSLLSLSLLLTHTRLQMSLECPLSSSPLALPASGIWIRTHRRHSLLLITRVYENFNSSSSCASRFSLNSLNRRIWCQSFLSHAPRVWCIER